MALLESHSKTKTPRFAVGGWTPALGQAAFMVCAVPHPDFLWRSGPQLFSCPNFARHLFTGPHRTSRAAHAEDRKSL
jgi:hypothetical protein